MITVENFLRLQAFCPFSQDLQAAKAMLEDSDITVAAVARQLNLAASTLYRHIPRARSASLETDEGAGYTDIGMMNRFGKPHSASWRMWILLPCLL